MFDFFKPRPTLDVFHAVLSRNAGRWYSACLRITRDEGLAEDAVQEALLKAWGQRAAFRGDAEIDTWIHRIAINTAIDIMRARKLVPDDDVDLDQYLPADGDLPPAIHQQHALGRDLSAAMTQLTAMEQQSFVLKHIEGWTLEEIAAKHQTNVNNIKQALFRAVRKLRIEMGDWRGDT